MSAAVFRSNFRTNFPQEFSAANFGLSFPSEF
jgi:hypothetical protein